MAKWSDVAKTFAEGNSLIGSPQTTTGEFSILSPKGGNTIVIEAGVSMRAVKIEFKGTGNSITFKSDSIVFGKFIAGHGGAIVIGEKTKMNKPCWFQAFEGQSINVGKGCLFADIRVRTSDIHSILSLDDGRRLNLAKDVNIGDRVWVAEKAAIYKGVTIGKGSVIGAHSVVTKSIPSNVVAVGIPAKVVQENIKWVRSMTPPEGIKSET